MRAVNQAGCGEDFDRWSETGELGVCNLKLIVSLLIVNCQDQDIVSPAPLLSPNWLVMVETSQMDLRPDITCYNNHNWK